MANACAQCLLAAVAVASVAVAYDDNPYGVVSHTAWPNKDEPVETVRMMGACRLGWNRVDCSWTYIEPVSNHWDFTAFDVAVDLCGREGIRVLPILGSKNWRKESLCERPAQDLARWNRYVRTVTEHLGGRCPVIEVINEPDAGWVSMDDYAVLLRNSYETIKKTNPSMAVAFAGLSPNPYGWLEGIYERNGGKGFYDIMNFHPYTTNFRNRPEGELEGEIAKMRKVMAKHGDGEKPLWITELGWPSQQTVKITDRGMVRKGLETLRPGKTDWSIAYVGIAGAESELDEQYAAGPLREVLPPGAKVRALTGEALKAELKTGGIDAVVYPFGESYLASTHAAVTDFVRRGGILVDLGGAPFYYGMSETAAGSLVKGGQYPTASYRELHVGVKSEWIDKTYPKKGYLPDGLPVSYYLSDADLKPGDEFIPLLKAKSGEREVVACAAYRFDSDLNGGLVLGTFRLSGGDNRNSEERQSLMLPRAILIALHSGVEKFFWYEFHAREGDRGDQESHFGITRKNHVPKPAFATYKTLIDRRPGGSKPLPGDWKSKDGADYFPQWLRPDGREGGAVWTLRKTANRRLRFSNPGELVFHDVKGMRVWFDREGDVFTLPLSDHPVYFTGGRLLKIDCP